MDSKKKKALEDVISRFYKDALVLRSRVLADFPGISKDEYEAEVGKLLTPFMEGLLYEFGRKIPHDEYVYLQGRIMDVSTSIFKMNAP